MAALTDFIYAVLAYFLGFISAVCICGLIWWRIDRFARGTSGDGQGGELPLGGEEAPLPSFLFNGTRQRLPKATRPDNIKALKYSSVRYRRELDEQHAKGEGLSEWE